MAKDFRYGLHVKKVGLTGAEDCRWKAHDRHGMKAKAGRIFHRPDVVSVCVYTPTGQTVLYLRKNADGTVYREEKE
jgi:hypothetical protein